MKSSPSLPSVIQRLLESANLRYDLVICGSAQQLMHGYVMKRNEPLYGRADEIIRLAPIPPTYLCKALNCNADEAIQEYAVWGGILFYDCHSSVIPFPHSFFFFGSTIKEFLIISLCLSLESLSHFACQHWYGCYR